jgi:hypothetical protein
VRIACNLLIFLFFHDEKSYEGFNFHADRTCRIGNRDI